MKSVAGKVEPLGATDMKESWEEVAPTAGGIIPSAGLREVVIVCYCLVAVFFFFLWCGYDVTQGEKPYLFTRNRAHSGEEAALSRVGLL